MDANQKRSLSLKNYWKNANKRRAQLRRKIKGERNPAKLPIVQKKISDSKLGKHPKHKQPLSEKQKAHLQRLAELNKEKRQTLETCKKISMSRKGKCKGADNHFYGKKHTKRTIEKIKSTHELRRSKHFHDIMRKAKEMGFNFGKQIEDSELKCKCKYNKEFSFLGYLIGTIPTDAYFDFIAKRNRYVYSISAKDKDFIEKVAKCLADINVKKEIKKYRNLWRIQTARKEITQFIDYLKKQKDTQWTFSEKVFDLDHNFITALLMAVCDAEGCITNSHSKKLTVSRRLTVTNSSLLLLKQIKSYFELFGIRSYIYLHRNGRKAEIKGKEYQFIKQVFTLIITGNQNLKRFRDNIGFSIKRKQKRLNNLLSSYRKKERSYTKEEYDFVLELSKHFSNCSDISKLVNIPSYAIRNWVLYNRKPRSVKAKHSL